MANEFVARKGIISLGGLTLPYRQQPSTYTATTDDYVIDCVSADITIHLPDATNITGQQYVIRNSSAGNITIDAFSSQVINGSQIQVLGRNDSTELVSIGNSGWKILQISGPISGATNNALLTSDGTIGGITANSGLSYDNKTLTIRGQDSGATSVETASYALNTPLTATTSNFNPIFSVTLSGLQNITVDYYIENSIGAKKSGTFKKTPTHSGTQSYDAFVVSSGGTINSMVVASAGTSNMVLFLRSAGANEVITYGRINVSSIKYS